MKEQASEWTIKGKKNTLNLFYWTASWTISVAIATFGPKFLWENNNTCTILAILINCLIGIGMVLANKRNLKGLDEMQQKIQLNSMAITLGVGLVIGIGYSLLDITNVVSFDAEISHLIIVMGLTYITSVAITQISYK